MEYWLGRVSAHFTAIRSLGLVLFLLRSTMMATTTVKPGTTTPAVTPPKRSLWKRLLVRLVMLLLVAAVGGAGYLYYRSNRLIKSEPYQAALKYVTESKLVKQRVGEPLVAAGLLENLRDGSNVTEDGKTGEAQLQFKMMSPKGPVEVSGRGRKFDDVWSITDLAVKLPGETEKLSLKSEVEVDTAKETPKFDATKPPEKVETKIDLPPPGTDIKIDLPSDLPMVPEK